MTSHFWIWWQGYVTVRLRGPGLERLLNEITNLGIALFNVERLTADTVIMRVGVKDFQRLRPLLWDTQIQLAILDKHGFPFLLHKFKIRSFLVVGLLGSFLFTFYLSNFIWFVEVEGAQSLSPAILKVAMEDLGLQVGVRRKNINPRQIESGLLDRFPVLAWAQVSVKGVKAKIDLIERKGVGAEYGGAGHVYAQNSGIITELLVLRGTPQVKVGDTVKEGDLLISGVYYDTKGVKQFGAAQGVVKARVWYQAVGEAPLTKWEALETGQKYRQYILSLGPLYIPLGKSRSPENHLVETKEWSLSLGAAMAPLGWKKVEYREVQYLRFSISAEDAKEEGYELAWESLHRRGIRKEDVLNERIEEDLIQDQDGIRITVWIEVEEDIGRFFSQ